MKYPVPAVLGIAAALVLWAGPAGAAVTVNFANPERYADAKLNGVAVLPALKAYFQQLGARHLSRGQDLKITVLDVDLAGREAPERGLSFPRILSGVTWPKIKVSYVLSQNRKVIELREELISDQFYQAQPGGRSSGDPLFYEKAMLDDWFRGRFGRQR